MKKNIIIAIFSCLFLVLISSFCLTNGNFAQAQENQSAATDDKNYIIGSGDILEIMTWKETDLSREVIVRLDGKITFPLLDDIQASGRTPLELKQAIQEKLNDYIDAPFVTVTLLQSASQTFYIIGEVMNTGEYHLSKDLTVLQALALAGGFTEWASKKEILLLRDENGVQTTIPINYKDLVRDHDFSKNILIQANDTIVVP